MGGRVPRRSATVYAAVARLSARPSTGFYLHCALPAIRALRAPLRQETSKSRRLCYRSDRIYSGGSPISHGRLYKIYPDLAKRMLAMLLCLSYIDFITYIDFPCACFLVIMSFTISTISDIKIVSSLSILIRLLGLYLSGVKIKFTPSCLFDFKIQIAIKSPSYLFCILKVIKLKQNII